MSFGLSSIASATMSLDVLRALRWYATTGSSPLNKYTSDLFASTELRAPFSVKSASASVSLLDGLMSNFVGLIPAPRTKTLSCL